MFVEDRVHGVDHTTITLPEELIEQAASFAKVHIMHEIVQRNAANLQYPGGIMINQADRGVQ